MTSSRTASSSSSSDDSISSLLATSSSFPLPFPNSALKSSSSLPSLPSKSSIPCRMVTGMLSSKMAHSKSTRYSFTTASSFPNDPAINFHPICPKRILSGNAACTNFPQDIHFIQRVLHVNNLPATISKSGNDIIIVDMTASANNIRNPNPLAESNKRVDTIKPFHPTNCNNEYGLASRNHAARMAYCECHIGSTFEGSVLRNRFKAEREIYCVVPAGAITLVFGSASKL
mmetsp:Transcript_15902/g.23827  ORF Transcript_15902/g.23827 Transcript_15902/m.23827 type:complete len:230 (-) Transcript_15902:511-1200(-)